MRKCLLAVTLAFLMATGASAKIGDKAILAEKELPHDSITNKICYQEVVLVDSSTSKNVLYEEARSWFASAFKASQDVIQMDDKENGKIIGKGNLCISELMPCSEYSIVRFMITIQMKDGRYKYTITDLNSSYYGLLENVANTSVMSGLKGAHNYFPSTDKAIRLLIQSLKSAMISSKAKKDNW